jgi:shikimate kinase
MSGLVLVGMRGAGKTTLGAMLASRLGLQHIDLDSQVVQAEGLAVNDLVSRRGLQAFRGAEHAALLALGGCDGVVLSVGGGVVETPWARERLRELGVFVVWLDADVETLASRVAGSERPSITGAPIEEEIAELQAKRAPLYHEVATVRVLTAGRTPREVCDELEHLWTAAAGHDVR